MLRAGRLSQPKNNILEKKNKRALSTRTRLEQAKILSEVQNKCGDLEQHLEDLKKKLRSKQTLLSHSREQQLLMQKKRVYRYRQW